MQEFYQKYGRNIKYSQNGEEGILLESLKRIGLSDKGNCVEFGAHNGNYCSNTMLLIDKGWHGTMIEADVRLFELLLQNSKSKNVSAFSVSICPANINDFVLGDVDVLSIDTDGDNDYDCFAALKSKPKIVIIEINSSFEPEVVGRKDCYTEMVALAFSKGYFLLCHTGNLIFIDNIYRPLFPEIIGNGIFNSELYFNRSWLKH